jgi:hypothetical protein
MNTVRNTESGNHFYFFILEISWIATSLLRYPHQYLTEITPIDHVVKRLRCVLRTIGDVLQMLDAAHTQKAAYIA